MIKKQTEIHKKIQQWIKNNNNYNYYTDRKYQTSKHQLFKRKTFNCSDRVGEMTENKRFTIESERINNSYSIHIRKDGEVIFEISNWDSLSGMHKKECEELVDYLNTITEENKRLKQDNKMLNRINDRTNGFNNLAHDRIFKLQKENEQLNQQIQILYQNIDFLKRFIEKRGFKVKLEVEIEND